MRIVHEIDVNDANPNQRMYKWMVEVFHKDNTSSSCGDSLVIRCEHNTPVQAKQRIVDELENLNENTGIALSILGEM